jgi:hypothetical protein
MTNKKCTFESCYRNAASKGYCDKHYRRLYRHGTLDAKRFVSEGDDIQRFLDKINKTDSCWIWTGGTRPNGKNVLYGRHHLSVGKSIGAHRFSYELFVGKIPDGQYICHACDVPLCVNPEHLFTGTHLDNMRDMKRKNRSYKPVGEKSSSAKLTNSQARKIKGSNLSTAELCKKYGVSQSVVSRIKRGASYNA